MKKRKSVGVFAPPSQSPACAGANAIEPPSQRPGPDRFKVGQIALLRLDAQTGFARFDQQRVAILRPRRWGVWHCGDLDQRAGYESGWRYQIVRRDGTTMNVEECHLRSMYEDERLSTWATFAKKTGLDVTARPTAARTRKSPA